MEMAESFLDKIEQIVNKSRESLKKSQSEYPKAIIFRSGKGGVVALNHIHSIIGDLLNSFPFSKDDSGKVNVRWLGDSSVLILLHNSCDPKVVLNKLHLNMEKAEKRNIPKYKIAIFEGNPLSSSSIIKVAVRNPDPCANKEYYGDFGEVIQLTRKSGRDEVLFNKLSPILPVMHSYNSLKYGTKPKISLFFFLHPEEENKAMPQFCIKTKNYTKPENLDQCLAEILQKFPFPNLGKKESQKAETQNAESQKEQKKKTNKAKKKDEEPDLESSEEEEPKQKRITKPNKEDDFLYDDDLSETDEVLKFGHPQNRFLTPAKRERTQPNTPIDKDNPSTFTVRQLVENEYEGLQDKRSKKCSALNKSGKPCGGFRMRRSKFCTNHQEKRIQKDKK